MHVQIPVRTQRRALLVKSLLLLGGFSSLVLLILEPSPPTPKGAGKAAFVWNRNTFWTALEQQFQAARNTEATQLAVAINATLAEIQSDLDSLAASNLPPGDARFGRLETNCFHLAPMVAAHPVRFGDYLQTCTRLRREVKRQSEHWDVQLPETRTQIYRLLYGSRAALEEVMLQLPRETIPVLAASDDEPSATPSALVHGVRLHSGDILISRGGAATSALIARGNDFPGNFSHVALVHVDEMNGAVSVIESHIESGVGVSSLEIYLADTKLRIMALRLRADLPQLVADPLLPHKAASQAMREATQRHIPYDFAMDHTDPAKQFCSEVAAAAYQPLGVKLWMGLSHLSTPGVTSWLAALGVRHFETQEPSDLEYDPQLRVVTEWRDRETLFKDHADNAVIDVMLEAAEAGERLGYDWYQLPFARLAKGYSVAKNWLRAVGPIPEGMSAATALRVQRLKNQHAAIHARLLVKAEAFQSERGYGPPYWELVRLAREARDDLAAGR